MAMNDQERIAKLRDGTWDHTIMRGPNPTGFCVDETPFAQATADRIEELVKERDEALAKLTKAVEALREILTKPRSVDQTYVELWADTIKEVRAVLAELEGGE